MRCASSAARAGRGLIGVTLAAALCLGARAAVPASVRYETVDGVPMAVYTYRIAPGEDPQALVQPDFTREGIRYAFHHFETVPILETDSREGTRQVEVQTATPDFETIRSQLQDQIEVEEDGYTGTLALDITSVETVPEGVQSIERTVSAVRQYPGLPSNDSAAIPKAIRDQGTTLTLTELTWAVEASQTISGVNFPIRWTATAAYTGTTTAQQAAGYRTSAVYRGTLTKETLTGITVSVFYTGTPVPAVTVQPTVAPTAAPTVRPTAAPTAMPTAAPTVQPTPPDRTAPPVESAPAPTAPSETPEPQSAGMPLPARIGCAALGLALLVSAGAVLHQVLRYNLKIYRPVAGGERYLLAGRYRVSEQNPVVRLREHIPQEGSLVAALDEDMADKLQGKEISLIAEDRLAVHTVHKDRRGAYWFRAVFGPGREDV